MTICVSFYVTLHADHGVLFGIFIRVLVLLTFWIRKVNGFFIYLLIRIFFPPHTIR